LYFEYNIAGILKAEKLSWGNKDACLYHPKSKKIRGSPGFIKYFLQIFLILFNITFPVYLTDSCKCNLHIKKYAVVIILNRFIAMLLKGNHIFIFLFYTFCFTLIDVRNAASSRFVSFKLLAGHNNSITCP